MRSQRTRIAALAFVLALPLSACGGSRSATQSAAAAAQTTADTITKAAYANDYAGVTSRFDDALKKQVTRASVGIVSDKMRALGDYEGLSLLATDAAKREYTFQAAFSKGKMNVVERLDAGGNVAAYRIIPLPS